MKKEINYAAYIKAFTFSSKVSFLETEEEFEAYKSALYLAIVWGKKVKSKSL